MGDELRTRLARIVALHGLGTTDGRSRQAPPNDSWRQSEWEDRLLDCIPGLAEERCYALADDILAVLAEQPAPAVEEVAPGTGDKLLTIARHFIDKHHVSCAEATINDGVYEEAPLLVEKLAEVAGYYTYPGDAA